MIPGSVPLETLLRRIHEQEEDAQAQQEAIRTLRRATLEPRDVHWLIACAENPDYPLAVRIGAVRLLGYHRPWLDLELLHDDRIHEIPARLAERVADGGEDNLLRDALIDTIGWQYLSEYHAWDALLGDPDAFLRREGLYELLRSPDRAAVERVIRHLGVEPEEAVRVAVAPGLCRHPLFFDVALTLLARPGGKEYFDTIYAVCETDLPGTTRALLNTDMKLFDVREALLRRLFRKLDHRSIACLIDLMQEPQPRFAVRMLRGVEADEAREALALLDQAVYLRDEEEWTNEAAKLALHYWERFAHLREDIRALLDEWRRRSPKITQLAMERNIFWRD